VEAVQTEERRVTMGRHLRKAASVVRAASTAACQK
jgi:hypothetical protein